MKNFLFLIFLIPFLSNCQSEKTAISKYPAKVGNIIFDEKVDDINFKRCISDDRFMYQYYNDSKGFQYKGEKYEIEKKLKSLSLKELSGKSGYITIRFVVNCEGKTGLFRMKQMNEDYKEFVFDEKLSNQLLIFTKSLNGWAPKEIEGKKIDYYQYLTYKIENGQVSEILP